MMGEAFYIGGVLLEYIPNQMKLTSCDKCDLSWNLQPLPNGAQQAITPQGTIVTDQFSFWPATNFQIDMTHNLLLDP